MSRAAHLTECHSPLYLIDMLFYSVKQKLQDTAHECCVNHVQMQLGVRESRETMLP